jgi:RIO kinase 1
MFDERQEQRLDAQVDALRARTKGTDVLNTYQEVFDRACLRLLQELINDGVIATLDYPVSTGKEANVFHATDASGKGKAVKIYRIATATFKNIARYIEGDPRFKRVKRATKPTIFAWAQKEYLNLARMHEAGVRVPAPFRVAGNVLVMEYIGDETEPAPVIRTVAIDDPGPVVEDIEANLRLIQRAKLVHADFSEYNLLLWDGHVVVIDVGQAVPLEHSRAEEWFLRDMDNTARYFRKLGVPRTAKQLAERVRGG